MARKLTVADFFSGAGGFSEGFRQAGFEVVFALDNWAPARNTHKLNHPSCKHPGLDCWLNTQGDILSLDLESINIVVPDVDVIIGSPPCVSFSTSNKAGKADKGLGIKLIEKYLQIIAIKKHRPNSKLKYWLLENVPNSRKHIKNKYSFRMLGLNKKQLQKLNIQKSPDDIALQFDISENKIFNSVNYNVPQKRERFITGEFPEPETKVTTDKSLITLRKVLSNLNCNSKTIIDPVYKFKIQSNQLTDHFYDTEIPQFEWEDSMIKKQQARYYGKMSFPEDLSKPSRTIMATRSVLSRESMIFPNGKPGVYRAPTIREVASLMSFPITYQFQGSTEAVKYRLVGNAVCPNMAFNFAKEIMRREKIVSKRKFKKINLKELEVNLKNNPPPKKKPRDKHQFSNYAEIIPDFKCLNFRVELDNSFPKLTKKIIWRASLHHATGRDNMKSTYPSLTEVKRLLGDSNMKSIMGLLNMKLNNLKKKIPKSAFVFQQRHIRVGKNNNLLSPRELLFCIRDILNQVLPADKFHNRFVDNSGRNHLKFNRGAPPENKIPVKLVAGLYSLLYVLEVIKNK